jgi:hypothetical protein
MTLIGIGLVAECGDDAFWLKDDEHGNVVVCGRWLNRFPAGSLSPQMEDRPKGFVGELIENHVLTIDSENDGPSLSLPGGKRVQLPKTAARGFYGSAYDRSAQKLYLLTVNSMLELSLRSLEMTETNFGNHPDAIHAYYENVIAMNGCAATYSYGLGFWSPRNTFRHDERPYCAAAILGPDRVIAAEDHKAIDVYDASGRLLETMEAPPGPIHALDTIDGQPWIAWVEDLAGEPTLGAEPTGRTVALGEAEVDVLNVWFENRVSYAKMLTGDQRAVYLGEHSVSPHVVIPEAHCVVFGTMDGTLVLWGTRTNDVETIELPERDSRRNPRIVSLLWCEPRQLLFIGTRDGGVYTARFEQTS